MRCSSIEQDFVHRVNTATAAGLPVILEAVGPKGHRLAAGVFDAARLTVTSDLRFRKVERVRALGLDDRREDVTWRQAAFDNRACLEVLTTRVVPAIDDVRREFSGSAMTANDAFDYFETEAREAVASVDLSARRAAIASRVLTKTRSVADENGIAGLCDHLDHHMARLIELRSTREEHNGPVAVAIGAGIAGTGFLIHGICAALSGGGSGCANSTVEFVARVHIAVGLAVMLIIGGAGADDGEGDGGSGLAET